jgi:hypothetical protein
MGTKYSINSSADKVEFFEQDVPLYEESFTLDSVNNEKYCLIDAYDHGIPLPSDCSSTSLLYKKLKENEHIKYIKKEENAHKVVRNLLKDNNVTSWYELPSYEFKKHSHAVVYEKKAVENLLTHVEKYKTVDEQEREKREEDHKRLKDLVSNMEEKNNKMLTILVQEEIKR